MAPTSVSSVKGHFRIHSHRSPVSRKHGKVVDLARGSEVNDPAQRLRHLKADVESRRVALRAFHQRQDQLAAASAKQTILLVFDRPMSLAGVWLLRMDSIGQPVIEIKLRGYFLRVS